jgi:hypothetical protein
VSSEIVTTKTFLPTPGTWLVEAVVTPGGSLPEALFLYEVTEEGELGEYWGISNRNELSSRSVWTGTPVSTFGNAFVRHDEMSREYETEEDADDAIEWIVESATLLSVELQGVVPEELTHVIP